MKVLGILFAVMFVLFFFFGNVDFNGNTKLPLLARLVFCLLGSAFMALILGLPVLGIIHLFE